MSEVVWLLIALNTGKFSEELKTGFYETQQECIDATWQDRPKLVVEGGWFSANIKQDGVERVQFEEWSCVPVVKTGMEIVSGGGNND